MYGHIHTQLTEIGQGFAAVPLLTKSVTHETDRDAYIRNTLFQKRKIFLFDCRVRKCICIIQTRDEREKERDKTQRRKKRICEPRWPLFN